MGRPVFPRLSALLALGLVVLTLAAFWPVLGNQFVNYDDDKYVTENPHIRGGLGVETVVWAFTTFRASNWHPLTWLSHALDCQIYGMTPLGHHLTNLLLHIANVLLLFFVLLRMTKFPWRSALVAALFAVHPLHVESVAWVAERKDVLSAFLWMLTMLAYARYTESPSVRRYLPVALLFGLGLLAKPMLVTLPLVLILLDYWPLRRFGVRAVCEKLPLVLLTAGSCMVTFVAQDRGGSVAELEGFAAGTRIGNAVVAYAGYIWKMLWPSRLACFYPHPREDLQFGCIVLASAMLICITAFVLKAAGRRPYLLFGWLWYIITLVPVIGLVQVGLQAMADRYTYVPLIGLFVMVTWSAGELLTGETEISSRTAQGPSPKGKRKRGVPRPEVRSRPSSLSPTRPLTWGLPALVLVTLVGMTSIQSRCWRDTFTLFEHAIAVTDGNYIAHANLAQALAEQRRFDEAIEHYREALKTDPDPGLTYSNLGVALAELGKLDEGMNYFRRSVKSDPDCVEGHTNLGRALAMQGETGKAMLHLSEALRLDPEHAMAYLEKGNILGRQGNLAEAEQCFRDALRLDPEMVEAHANLGYSLLKQERLDEAILHLRQAIQITPDFAVAHYHLGTALYMRHNYPGALSEFRLAQQHGLNVDPQILDAVSRGNAGIPPQP